MRTGQEPLIARAVVPAVAALAALLLLTGNGYGYHRDELYFRALPPEWGYLDQPPFTPWLARTMAGISDQLWVLRLPAVACAVVAVVIVALIAAEVGGGARAQALAAWGSGFGVFPLVFGHILLTTSIELVTWPLVGLFVLRAITRDPRWLLGAGVVVGLSTLNKLLIAFLVASLLAGIVAAGPRRLLASRWLWIAGAVAAALSIPALLYQASAGWPQLQMGSALVDENGADVRPLLIPFLALLLGPPLTVVWLAGLIWPWRERQNERVKQLRFLAPALVVLVLLCLASPGQVYYPLGLVTVAYGVGCAPVARWMSSVGRRVLVWGLLAVNAANAAVSGLPLIPAGALKDTPIPELNQAVADQIGWPEYVAQIADAYQGMNPSTSTIITANYGEWGALDRFGPQHGLPQAHSGHNHLAELAPPPEAATDVLLVGEPRPQVGAAFGQCTQVGALSNTEGVTNEEVGTPLVACTGRSEPWNSLWPKLAHLG